jgi:hypothetical protein
MKISTIQVLEISPFTLAPEAELPEKSRHDDPEAWADFSRRALTAINAGELSYLGVTDYISFTSVIASCALDEILALITPLKGCEDLDELIALDGGMAFLGESGTPLLTPQCCSDLSNLKDWQAALANTVESAWQYVWIGHPVAYVRHAPPNVEVSSLHSEAGPAPADDEEPDFILSRTEFERTFNEARRERLAAVNRIAEVISRLAPALPSERAARILLALEDQN